MCIRDSGTYARYTPDENKEPSLALLPESKGDATVMGYPLDQELSAEFRIGNDPLDVSKTCLLYTSDAADERSSVDLGGRRIINKKKRKQNTKKKT